MFVKLTSKEGTPLYVSVSSINFIECSKSGQGTFLAQGFFKGLFQNEVHGIYVRENIFEVMEKIEAVRVEA